MLDQKSRTECQTTAPELERRLTKKGADGLKLISDEKSVTSITIVRTFLTTWQARYPHCMPILFCDQARYPTNAYVLEYFANKLELTVPPISQVLIPIPRLDIHPNSTPEKQAEKLARLQEKGVEETEALEVGERQAKPA